LLEASMEGAHGVLLSIAGGSDLGLFEINEAASLVQEAAHPEANIIFGTVIDDSLGDEVRVTVIAAGFDSGGPAQKRMDPTPVSARTVASGQSGRVGQPSRSPQAPMSPPAGAAPSAAPMRPAQPGPARPGPAQPGRTTWQPATGGLRPGAAPPPTRPTDSSAHLSGRAIPVTADFDDDDEVDVPPFMKR